MNDLRIEFVPIGIVRTDLTNAEVKESWPNGTKAEIEVFAEYAEGLDGIDALTNLMVLFYLNEITEDERKILKVRPRRLIRHGLRPEDMPLLGVFCLDSPIRPNPIGLTIVRFLGRNRNILRVSGLDAYNGTPVLDIKPYKPDRCNT
jgi:tRNA-Thr(GGU) m(6)t(6)A37 methyltransferase TsaA